LTRIFEPPLQDLNGGALEPDGRVARAHPLSHFKRNQRLETTVAEIHEQGGLAIVPHPFSAFTKGMRKHAIMRIHLSTDPLVYWDALEGYNPSTAGRYGRAATIRLAAELGLPLVTVKNPLEAWVVDDTSFPKKGDHSVGVAPQYCGNLGKQANCQDAVSISLANHHAGLPVAYRLYLPEGWTDDPARCKKAGVPAGVTFQKKWEIALSLVDNLLKEEVPQAPFHADAGYGGPAEAASQLADGLA